MSDPRAVESAIKSVGTSSKPVMEAISKQSNIPDEWLTHVRNAADLIKNWEEDDVVFLHKDIFENRQTLNKALMVLDAMQSIDSQHKELYSTLGGSITEVREYMNNSDLVGIRADQIRDVPDYFISKFRTQWQQLMNGNYDQGLLDHITSGYTVTSPVSSVPLSC